jgi:hypothetical protein
MAPQPSSLRTSYRALFITSKEGKKSVIYDGRRRRFAEGKVPIWLEIELIDASGKSHDRVVGEFSSI